jgi:hypothetical protein
MWSVPSCYNNMLLCVKCTFDQSPSIFVRDKPIFSSERMLCKEYYRKSSVEKKSLVVGLKGLDAKTNWLVVNHQSWSNFDFDNELSPVEADSNTWSSSFGESRIWDSKMWSWVPRDSDPRMRWQGPSEMVNCRPIFSSKRMLRKDYVYNRKCSVEQRNCWSWISRDLAPRRTDWR